MNNKSCIYSKFISDYLEDILSKEDKIKFEEHLKNCPSCNNEIQNFRNLETLLSNLPEYKAPADIKDKVLTSVYFKQSRKNAFGIFSYRSLIKIGEVAAIFVLILIGWNLYKNKNEIIDKYEQKKNKITEKKDIFMQQEQHDEKLQISRMPVSYTPIPELPKAQLDSSSITESKEPIDKPNIMPTLIPDNIAFSKNIPTEDRTIIKSLPIEENKPEKLISEEKSPELSIKGIQDISDQKRKLAVTSSETLTEKVDLSEQIEQLKEENIPKSAITDSPSDEIVQSSDKIEPDISIDEKAADISSNDSFQKKQSQQYTFTKEEENTPSLSDAKFIANRKKTYMDSKQPAPASAPAALSPSTLSQPKKLEEVAQPSIKNEYKTPETQFFQHQRETKTERIKEDYKRQQDESINLQEKNALAIKEPSSKISLQSPSNLSESGRLNYDNANEKTISIKSEETKKITVINYIYYDFEITSSKDDFLDFIKDNQNIPININEYEKKAVIITIDSKENFDKFKETLSKKDWLISAKEKSKSVPYSSTSFGAKIKSDKKETQSQDLYKIRILYDKKKK